MVHFLNHVGLMLSAGLRFDQILRLMRFKHRIRGGRRSELTQEHKRLAFYRQLYLAGRLREETLDEGAKVA